MAQLLNIHCAHALHFVICLGAVIEHTRVQRLNGLGGARTQQWHGNPTGCAGISDADEALVVLIVGQRPGLAPNLTDVRRLSVCPSPSRYIRLLL